MTSNSHVFLRDLGAAVAAQLGPTFTYSKSKLELKRKVPEGHDVIILSGSAKYSPYINVAFYYGKNFAAAGGVTAAVQEVLAEEKFDMPVSCVKCSGAAECKKALMLLRAGKLNETMIEGMVCEGGCVNGPAKITDPRESLGMRRQLMLGADDRSIADNLEMNDFKDIDMKDGRM